MQNCIFSLLECICRRGGEGFPPAGEGGGGGTRGRRRRRRWRWRTQKEEETTASLEKKAGRLSIWGWGRVEPLSCLAPPRPWPTGTGTKQRWRCVDLGLGTGRASAATTNQQRRRGRSMSRLRAAELGGTEGSIRWRRTSIRPGIEHGEPLRPLLPCILPCRSRSREATPSGDPAF
jgi:hypothetical protein